MLQCLSITLCFVLSTVPRRRRSKSPPTVRVSVFYLILVSTRLIRLVLVQRDLFEGPSIYSEISDTENTGHGLTSFNGAQLQQKPVHDDSTWITVFGFQVLHS